MSMIRKIFLLAVTLLATPQVFAIDLIINEIMQSNLDATMDDVNEFPDSWVEIYNPTDEKILLDGYKIGTGKKADKAYSLPGYAVWPHSYFLIYCDKKGFNRHADFRLDSGKGSVYLFHGDEIIDQIDYKAQPFPNVSYGRESDMSDVWGYQLTPTPESANTGGITSILLGEPIFSIPGRVGSDPLTLELSLPKDAPENTVIRYTLNGSEPTVESDIYADAIRIEENTVVRAKLFCEGAISPRSTTHSYIFHPQEMTIPIISLVTNDEFLYSDEIGILSDALHDGKYPNYVYDWRRPVNFEYFPVEGTSSALNQICETKIKGNATRENLIKSMVIYANKRFGTKRFNYEFFPEQKPGITDFKALDLRNAGNDGYRAYMRDALAQRMMGEYADLDWQAWQPSVVYINGKYLGILNIRERADENYVYTHYDGLEDIDMVENWGKNLEEGTMDNFLEFVEFYSQEGHTIDEYEEYMDISEFANYFLVNMVYANYDFPGNNLVMWRPIADGGKWRWICKDMDDALGNYALNYDFDYLDWMHHPDKYPDKNWACYDESTMLFRRLLEVPEFKELFLERFVVYTGDFLSSSNTIDKMEAMWKVFEQEWPDHYEKNTPHWHPHESFRKEIADFLIQRYDIIHSQLAEWFDLGKPVETSITNDYNIAEGVTLQDITLAMPEFKGKFFAGQVIRLAAESLNENFEGWIIEVNDDNGDTTTLCFPSEKVYFTVPNASSLNIYPTDNIKEPSLTIIDIIDMDEEEEIQEQYFNLNGLKLKGKPSEPGIFIVKSGEKIKKVIL